MQVIPVIDLKDGVVVRGIAGRREEYRPLVSRLCASAAPADVAQGLVRAFGFRTAYVADLDAIAGAEPNWQAYEAVHAAGLSLWIDAGVGTLASARQFAAVMQAARYGVARIVLGLESLEDPANLPPMLNLLDPARVIFSLDLKEGMPLTRIDSWRKLDAREIAARVIAVGVQSLLVLDLAAVGTSGGPTTLELGRTLHAEFPHVRLIGGGGVRNAEDLAGLAGAGFTEALVATALHDAGLRAEQL